MMARKDTFRQKLAVLLAAVLMLCSFSMINCGQNASASAADRQTAKFSDQIAGSSVPKCSGFSEKEYSNNCWHPVGLIKKSDNRYNRPVSVFYQKYDPEDPALKLLSTLPTVFLLHSEFLTSKSLFHLKTSLLIYHQSV